MMTMSRGFVSATALSHVVADVPAWTRRAFEAAFRNEFAHAARKAAQAHLGTSQGARRKAARSHAGLHPLDERLVLEAHPAIDAPIEIARGTHLAPVIGMRIGDLADQSLRGRDRYHLHEIDLIRIDVEGHIRPQLEIGP